MEVAVGVVWGGRVRIMQIESMQGQTRNKKESAKKKKTKNIEK